MADIHLQPGTSVYGPYGGYGEYAGFSAANQDGTAGAVGGAAAGVGALGNQRAGAGVVAAGPNGVGAAGTHAVVRPNGSSRVSAGAIGANAQGVAGKGAVYANNQYVEGGAAGAFQFNRQTGELNAAGEAQWVNKATGESHNGGIQSELTLGKGGTVMVTKDGQSQTYEIPPRPWLA